MRDGTDCRWLRDLTIGGPTSLRFILQYASNWSSDFLSSIDPLISACASARECSEHWAPIATRALYCRFLMSSRSAHQCRRSQRMSFALVIVATCLITATCCTIWLG